MAERKLEIRPDELSQALLEHPREASAEDAAEAVRGFLNEKQPRLAARVMVHAAAGVVVIECAGERALDTLRAVEGVLGIPDRLPEVSASEDLPELEWNEEPVEPAQEAQPRFASDEEVLRSRVRYFPLPECQWFDIRQGILTLTGEKIVFQPEHHIPSVAGDSSKEHMEIPLGAITGIIEDTWFHLRCLRVETELEAYRFGRAQHRGKVELIFEVDDWLQALRHRLEEQT